MEKLPMCRLCLAENVRMYVVINKDLHALYERLTDNPFVTGDRRPMLACFICCTKLKQCCLLQRKCLEAEELLAQMMNEDNELNPPINQDHFGCRNELTISPMVHVSIESDDECQAESDPIKKELPDVCERLDDVIEPEEEHQSDDLELENLYKSYSQDMSAQPSESDLEDDVPLIEIKTEMEEEQEVPRKKRRASDTTRSAVGKESTLCRQRKKNEESGTRVALNTQHGTSRRIAKFHEPLPSTTPRVDISVVDTTLDTTCRKKKLTKPTHIRTGGPPYKCDICQRTCIKKALLIQHIRVHTGEKPYKCEECQLCFSQKGNLTTHIRTHTGDKPYKCKECQLCFSQKGHLTTHILTHTGDKPYKCEDCQLSFSRKGSLTEHIRTHTGEKPFKCEECELCFRHKISLKIHIRSYAHRRKILQM
ncbi:hypothetical protein PYW08_012426 [Mythimna loreyi]|uniref:Uncharacterized protein n=1 Tax=Mythimna loreyi TaxID=667449 RepID=A0ACC2Q3R6_9NEOP|nr:hypothetical protein PYW08_012426 [Mythimna loreyi]